MNFSGLSQRVDAIIRRAGDVVVSYRGKPLVRKEKEGAGFVTEADIAVEDFLLKELSTLEPDIAFFSEENGKSGREHDYCWVIDPLDGTTNFAYGVPHFCISVALTYKNNPVMGFVYQPLLREMFSAERGKGSFLNGSRLKVSGVRDINESFLLFCIPYGKNAGAKKLFEHVLALSQKAYSMRLLGAAALDQSYVGAGRFDGMFFEQLSWWDVAAGSLIIQEAGGKVSDYAGNEIQPNYGSFIAGNPWIHEILVNELGKR